MEQSFQRRKPIQCSTRRLLRGEPESRARTRNLALPVLSLSPPVNKSFNAGVLAPVALHFDEKLKEDLVPHQGFDLLAGRLTDSLELLTLCADEDSLLALALDQNR